MDILSACNLVNYFGKMVLGGSGVGQITLNPILIRKVGWWIYDIMIDKKLGSSCKCLSLVLIIPCDL